MMYGTRLVRFTAALSGLAALVLLNSTAGADEPVGSAQIGDTYCPCPPYMMPPASPYMPAPFAPGMPAPSAPMAPSTPQQQLSPQQQSTPQQPSAPQQPAAAQQAPAQAAPTFTPTAASTAATAPQATAPNTIGDFFGPTTVKPIFLPGEVVNQAIFVEPFIPAPPPPVKGGTPIISSVSLLDYFRVVTPTGVGTFETASDVLLGTGKSGVSSASLSLLGKQLLMQYDGSTFTGDPADLGPLTDDGKFFALDSGMTGDVDLLDPEDPLGMTTLFDERLYDIRDAIQVFIPTPGGAVGRQKIVENNSVFPRDRVFLNYSGFTDVPLSPTGENVHRFVPGFEMAFLQERMSVEVRMPFAATIDSDIRASGLTARNELEFGNVVTTVKALVAKSCNSAIGIGASMTIPTAADITVHDFFGEELISLENNSVHVLPFIGVAHFGGRWFSQAYVQADFDTSGNRVLIRSDETGRLADEGDLTDSTFVYVSASVGYWLYQNGYKQTSFVCQNGRHVKRKVSARDRWITGFAPIAELHYNRTVDSGDMVSSGGLIVMHQNEFSLTNLVLGGLLTFGDGGSINLAWATPIIGQDDQQFDNEVRAWLEYEL